MTHTAEILSVGTELLLGNIANTDAQDVSVALSELGIDVRWHTVVGDNPERVKQAVAVARTRADILIATGGLGPTYDDLTKQTLAEAFGKKLQAAGITVEMHRIGGGWHGFDTEINHPCVQETLKKRAAYIRNAVR